MSDNNSVSDCWIQWKTKGETNYLPRDILEELSLCSGESVCDVNKRLCSDAAEPGTMV